MFYIASDNRLMAAHVDANGGVFAVKKVEALFALQTGPSDYDVSADGQRFLAALPPYGEIGEPLTVVQNWTSGLKK